MITMESEHNSFLALRSRVTCILSFSPLKTHPGPTRTGVLPAAGFASNTMQRYTRTGIPCEQQINTLQLDTPIHIVLVDDESSVNYSLDVD